MRLAIIGVGRMGAFHARCLAGASGVGGSGGASGAGGAGGAGGVTPAGASSVEVVAVADASQSSLDAVADVLHGAALYATADEAFAHPGLEACLIATPTPTHPDLVRRALAAGLHVLCEKPLSLEPEESELLGALARDAGRVLQVGFWRRFSPPWRRAREAIVAGQIGQPLMVRLSQWDADPPPASFCDPAVSGGLAVDCGVHEFDLAEWLTGCSIERVRAWSLPPVDGGVAEVGDVDNLVAVLELSGGAVATVDLSRNARYGDDVRTEILGSRGALLVDLLPTGRTRIGTSDGMAIMPGSDVDDATAAGVVGQIEAFAMAVRSGQAVELPGAAASARATAVAHAVRRAATTGEVVAVDRWVIPLVPVDKDAPASEPAGAAG